MAKTTDSQKRAHKKWVDNSGGKAWMLMYNRFYRKLQRRDKKILKQDLEIGHLKGRIEELELLLLVYRENMKGNSRYDN